MKVLIGGAGIGGLTAAFSLQKVGIDVTVYEGVRDIRPLGVGINLLPHAARELIELGLQAELDKFAIRTCAIGQEPDQLDCRHSLRSGHADAGGLDQTGPPGTVDRTL